MTNDAKDVVCTGQAGAKIENAKLMEGQTGEVWAYGSRGVYVPPGMTAAQIMRGAAVLEERYNINHYEARSMVRAVLRAIMDSPAYFGKH